MASIQPHPHWKINVVDNSIYRPIEDESLPLHKLICPMKAQSGPVGELVWCPDFKFAKTVYGSETFNEDNKLYYSLQAKLAKTMFERHGVWIIRLADDTATSANVVLEAVVTKDTDCPTWSRDSDGIVNTVLGKPVPEMDTATPPAIVTQTGMSIVWRTRALLDTELENGIGNISPSTNGDEITYPIMVELDAYPGALGSDRCFSLYRDFANLDALMIQNIGSQIYTMAPKKKLYGNVSVANVLDENGNVSNQFSFLPDAKDPVTTAKMYFGDHFPTRYSDLPASFAIYHENINAIGQAWLTDVQSGSYDDEGIVITDNGMMVDIFTGKDFKNDPYPGLWVVTSETELSGLNVEAGLNFNSANNIYATNGTDGVLDDVTIEGELIKFCSGTLAPTIVDKLRYPMTHVYDMGCSLDTKKALLEAMTLRDDLIVTVATQDLSVHYKDGETPVYESGSANPTNGLRPPINNEYQDESVAISLRAYGLLFPESIDKGTGACRFSIGMQVGTLPSNELVPCSLRIAQMRSEYMGTEILQGSFGGRPNSECNLFESVNYTPSSEDSKGRLWAAGGNYLSYFDRVGLFYAALRTGYRHETSVLSSLYFVDTLTYTKQLIGKSWTLFSGMDIPFDILQQQITDDLTNKLATTYNGKYVFSVRVYQTAEEQKRGYETHVAVDIQAPATNRVWNVDINCSREGFTPE